MLRKTALPSAKKNTLGKAASLPSVFWHSVNNVFAECFFALGKATSLPSVFFCRVFFI
jgi:hypothetical protein